MCSGLLYHCISAIREWHSLWWRHLASDVASYWLQAYWVVSRLSPGGDTVSPSMYAHCWYCVKGSHSEVDRWKTVGYIRLQKSPRKGTSVGCPLGDGNSVGVAEGFPWPVVWSQIWYPKKRGFRQIRSLNGNFSGMWNVKPIARFRWKRARLSLFRPQPPPAKFYQIHPSFRDLLAKTTFQIITIIGDPIGTEMSMYQLFYPGNDLDRIEWMSTRLWSYFDFESQSVRK